jgi:hypothetical protein
MLSRHSDLLKALALGILLAFGAAGCRSLTQPASASFASVTIKNHTAQEIASAAAQVFAADGYRGGVSGNGELVFEKEASRMTSFAREGLVDATYGQSTVNRVRAQIVPLADNTFRLQCKAYMVTGGNDTFFQDEVPLANVRRMPYQRLLDKVADSLK